jgi:hypothetical protein
MFKVEVKGIAEAMEAFDPKKVQAATASALNKLMDQVKTAAVKKVTETWNIKRNDLTTTGTGNARLQIKRATWGNQTVTLFITGRPVSLSYFGAVQIYGTRTRSRKGNEIKPGAVTKRMLKAGPLPQGVKVQIKRGQQTILKSAFLARVKAGGQGQHIGVFNRYGKARLPILEKKLISIPSMFGQAPVMSEVQRLINEKWESIFRHELTFYMNKK